MDGVEGEIGVGSRRRTPSFLVAFSDLPMFDGAIGDLPRCLVWESYLGVQW